MRNLRLRRLRRIENLRKLVRETRLSVDNLIMPLFVKEAKDFKAPIRSMPGVFQLSPELILKEAKALYSLGVPAVILFGIPKKKDETGSHSYKEDGVIQETIKRLKDSVQDLVVITDVCLCSYTSHGHCGIIRVKGPRPSESKRRGRQGSTLRLRSGLMVSEVEPSRVKGKGQNSTPYALSSMFIDNDATLEVLAEIAVSHAKSGADIVAPSAMMDHQVASIREALDSKGFYQTGIMSYSSKFASNFYGPFREAAESAPLFGDRKSYQMDFANSDEALREAALDIEEGADIIMVKPALCYLDIIYRLKNELRFPLAAYSVSGEYSMVKVAKDLKVFSEREVVVEILTSIKRAGADMIITYWAKEAAEWLS